MTGRGENLRFGYKIWIETENGKGVLGYGQQRLLKAIKEKGTLNDAIIETGLHYRKIWEKLKKIESLLGFRIIITRRGGAEKGKTVLTEKGKKLIETFERFHERYDDILKTACETATKDFLRELSRISPD
ncbi:MAG TPA: hypothetical protein PKW56_04585 [Clostridiales bacterium]|nr:hypothetical protein [Clostridiales bacterium]